MAAVVLASLGMSVSTFVGASTAAVAPWLLVPIVALWAYFTGLAATARLANEPPRGLMTPELARLVIATVARLAHAELALHTLILSPVRPAIATGDFSAALASALGSFASALRALRPPQAIPELRPVEVPLRGTPLATIADVLVDATNTLHSILSDRLPAGTG